MKKRTLIIGLIFLFFNGIAQRQLPGVIVEDMEGKSGDIRGILNDSVPVVLAFWGTTCKPCIQELDALSEVFEDWKKRVDFKVVAVSTDDSRAAVKVRPMQGVAFYGHIGQESGFKAGHECKRHSVFVCAG